MRHGRGAITGLFAVCLLGTTVAHAGTVFDMIGRRVELRQPPRRVIPLAPSLTEIVFALGAGQTVVGVIDYLDYPPEARTRPSVGGGLDPNFEVIVALRPDVVLVSADANRWDTLVRLEGLQVPVFGVKTRGVAGVFASIVRVGEVMERRTEAEAVTAAMRRRMDAVGERIKGRDRPRVLYVIWIDPLIVAGQGTVIDDLIRIAGGDNVVEVPGFPRYALEQVVARPPDLILLSLDRGGPDAGDVLSRLPVWRDIRAVRKGAVRVVEANVMNRPGPRIAEAVETLARLFHPTAFPGRRP
jgi:iron complex transport system substrate-binding protein